jgi:phosphopantothenoylcysteine decarboxylase/phosphopantothenate--cysteine ligase
VEPGCGKLACGAEGPGRLAELEEIARSIERVVDKAHAPQPWINKKVLVTAGPTREYLDPVRFLSNPSSGKMGFALAEAALQMGAEVILVHGPVVIDPPESPHLKVLPVTSAKEMYDAVFAHVAEVDLVLMCAAVADARPATCSPVKLPKGSPMPIEWLPTPDILASLGAWRADAQKRGEKTPVLIGFAAQTGDPVSAAQEKRARKQVDWIVANDVTAEGAGFMGDTNRVSVVTASKVETWGLMFKSEVAEQLCQRIDDCFFKVSRA